VLGGEDNVIEDNNQGEDDHNLCGCLPLPPMLQERRAGDRSKLTNNNNRLDGEDDNDEDNNIFPGGRPS